MQLPAIPQNPEIQPSPNIDQTIVGSSPGLETSQVTTPTQSVEQSKPVIESPDESSVASSPQLEKDIVALEQPPKNSQINPGEQSIISSAQDSLADDSVSAANNLMAGLQKQQETKMSAKLN